MTTTYVELDVRPVLKAGGEPFGAIMAAVSALAPDQGLRLLATFEPRPLFAVLGARGYAHEATRLADGDWQVLFHPAATPDAPATAAIPASRPQPAADWPAPVRTLDNRDLDPPEPMVRILAATEEMQPGEVLAALLGREPLFLFPELAKRGHAWQGGFEPDGETYRLLVRIGRAGGAA